MKKEKRRRGGQPGNHNARKHGMYAVNLLPEHVAAYWKARQEGAPHEVAMWGVKIQHALLTDPANTRIFHEAADALAEYFIMESKLVDKASGLVKKMVRDLVDAVQEQALNRISFEKSRTAVVIMAWLKLVEEW